MSENLVKALCNDVRLQIITCLGQREKTVNELISTCGLSQSAVSQHLAKLKSAGLVKCVKTGREIKYSVIDPNITKVTEMIIKLSKEDQ